jgi:hypothetical protein
MFDASRPPARPFPGCAAVAGYIGGDTPHVWTLEEWNQASNNGALRQLPIWVASWAIHESPFTQGRQAVNAAVALGWHPHHEERRVIALDLETAVHPEFVSDFAREVHLAGFGVWVYGSESTVFGNPAEQGYWVAAYPGPGPVLDFPEGHAVAHQYAAEVPWLAGAVDLSVISEHALQYLGRGPRRLV